jgi:hypothetical protein
MKTKALFAIAAALIIGAAIYGGYQYPIASTFVGASTPGATQSTAKIASVAVNLATTGANGTSTSLFNGDANDRIVTNGYATCSTLSTSYTPNGLNTGIASLLLQAATTSTASPVTVTNTNLAINVPIATTTPTDAYTATSSYAYAPTQRWAAGTYMTFFTNATNTASCTFGVNYIAS